VTRRATDALTNARGAMRRAARLLEAAVTELRAARERLVLDPAYRPRARLARSWSLPRYAVDLIDSALEVGAADGARTLRDGARRGGLEAGLLSLQQAEEREGPAR
jgi:hypothetical protein